MSLNSTQKLLLTLGHMKYLMNWSQDIPLCIFSTPACQERAIVESSEHIVLFCQTNSLIAFCLRTGHQLSHNLVNSFFLSGPMKLIQFLLYFSAIPEVIAVAQHQGNDVAFLQQQNLVFCSPLYMIKSPNRKLLTARFHSSVFYLFPQTYETNCSCFANLLRLVSALDMKSPTK